MKEPSDGQQDVAILIVEEDDNEVLLLSRALSRTELPAAATFVQSPQELQDYLRGIGKFSDRQRFPFPEVILTDYRMCGSSASDVINFVRAAEQFKAIPIVVLSSFVPPREIDAMLVAGAQAYLERPVEFSGYRRVLQHAMKLARN